MIASIIHGNVLCNNNCQKAVVAEWYKISILGLIDPGSVFNHTRMEINSHYNHVSSDDLNKNSAPVLKHRNVAFSNIHKNDSTNNQNPICLNSMMHEQPHFKQRILYLQQQQELQRQTLLNQYEEQKKQLNEEHEKQMQLQIKILQQQQKFEEEQQAARERKEQEKLESLKKKDKHEQSAIASSEVKQKLQEFVLKKQREAAAHSANTSPSNVQNWHPVIGKYGEDFQLRRTASEPNLKLRSIIKQKVYERRSSPLTRRREKGPHIGKRRSPLTNSSCNTTDSGPTSPSSGIVTLTRSSGDSTPIQEEPNGYNASTSQGSMGDLILYQSPSMPNISLGRPPVPASSSNENATTTVSEAQIRAMAAARFGAPLTSNSLFGPLPYYPSLPVIEGEFTPPTSPVFVSPSNKDRSAPSLSQVIPGQYPVPGAGISDAQVAQVKFPRSVHRPLSRTQSAPLPLGHPVLSPGNPMSQQQHEQYMRKKIYDQQQHHNLLKQHIRQTVLTRANSKNHVENLEEETEAAIAQEMKDEMETMTIPEEHSKSQQPEVIDLTDKKEMSGLAKQQRVLESFLQQQRDIMAPHNALAHTEVPSYTARYPHTARPLARAYSSPAVKLLLTGSPQESSNSQKISSFTTGVVYDSLMLKHQCTCGNNSNHPEHGGRLQSIWARFQETGLLGRCERIKSRKATLEELKTVHSEAHVLLFGTNPSSRQNLDESQLSELPIKDFVILPCGGIGVDSDTMWSELYTAGAACMAAGCVTELALKVAVGEVKNGFAVVRPPGHHAEHMQAMGFCFFNSVAVAAKQLREKLKLEKIMIVDWDVHHGNGIQQAFYDDPHILYLSLHRHDNGNFFPGTGDSQEVGVDDGVGFNVNIAWSGGLNPPLGDAEYLAAFRTIVLPIARDYDPEIILVACGFDAAYGHQAPLGGYQVTPACFGYMTQQLMLTCQGKVVLALEGGYDLPAICDASQNCLMALLGDEIAPPKEEELRRKPCHNAVETLHRTVAVQAAHWPCIKGAIHTIEYSVLEFQQKDKEEADTVSALALLSVVGNTSTPAVSTTVCSPVSVDEPMEQDQEK
ncbi:Histone deacetylase 4 [Nymphon striatum]|nr:Histone deacetylase 4 [Nymphon striatum]